MKDLTLFDEIDRALCELARTDSSIEYANHIRPEFNCVIVALNRIKGTMNVQPKDNEEYFS